MDEDWCPTCESPQFIVDTHLETEVRTIWGTGPEWLAIDLACGHQVSVPTGRTA